MIRSLLLRNFQAHRFFKLKLSPTVTSIIGPSDVGKSALIRALQWLALNSVRGASFVRKGTSQATVALKLDDHLIKRSKGKGGAYVVDGKRLAAFGAKVPDEVTAILNMGSINFQGQHDPVLWFSESPGHVSRELNRIVDLGVIDSTLKKIADMIRSSSSEEKVIQKRLGKARAERKELKPVLQASKEMARLEKQRMISDENGRKDRRLTRLILKAKRSKKLWHGFFMVSLRGEKVLTIGESLAKARRTSRALASLLGGANHLRKLTERKIPPLRALEDLEKKLRKSLAGSLEETVASARKELWKSEHLELQLSIQEAELKKEFRECPLCEGRIPSSRSAPQTFTSPSNPRLRVRKRTPG